MNKIPEEIKEKVISIIAAFNKKVFGKNSKIALYADFRGNFLYLNRRDGQREEPLARLKFKGKIDNWEFAIFKWSSEKYDSNEFLFPGSNHLDGTIEGALEAANEAYPPGEPSTNDVLSFLKILMRR